VDTHSRQPGELIRAARGRAGITQQQLAIRAGTSQAAISRLERGGPSPSCDTLDRLLRVMGRQLELRATAHTSDDLDLDEIRRARAMPIEQRLQRAFAWNAFAARIAGAATRDRRPES
jgi:uncharacterized protein